MVLKNVLCKITGSHRTLTRGSKHQRKNTHLIWGSLFSSFPCHRDIQLCIYQWFVESICIFLKNKELENNLAPSHPVPVHSHQGTFSQRVTRWKLANTVNKPTSYQGTKHVFLLENASFFTGAFLWVFIDYEKEKLNDTFSFTLGEFMKYWISYKT